MTRTARLATGAEQGTVERITVAAYAEYTALLDRPPLPVTEDYAPRIAAGQVWLVAEEGVDVALAVLETEPDYMMIFSLAALPAGRGGIGRWLLGFAEEQARAAGLPEIRLYTNALMARNIRIYGQAGYGETGREPHPQRPGWTIVHMAKPL